MTNVGLKTKAKMTKAENKHKNQFRRHQEQAIRARLPPDAVVQLGPESWHSSGHHPPALRAVHAT